MSGTRRNHRPIRWSRLVRLTALLTLVPTAVATAASGSLDGSTLLQGGSSTGPDLEIHKNARHHAEVGTPIQYEILVTNAGGTAVPATEVEVTDPAAAAAPLEHFADRQGDGDASLEPGEVWEYRLAGGVSVSMTPTTCRNVVNEAAVKPVSGEKNTSKNTSRVETHIHCHQDVELAKTSDKSVYRPGETITYSITVTNESDIPLPLANVHVSDPMLASVTPQAPVPAAIAVGGSLTYVGQKLVTEADCGRLRNRAEVVVDQEIFYSDPDIPPHLLVPDPTSNSGMGSDEREHADHEVTVRCQEDLDIVKSTDKVTYLPGETIIYTVAVHNSGDLPVAVNRIHVFDPTLPNLTLVGNAPEKLAPGADLIYRGTRLVTPADCGPIVNVATLGVAMKDDVKYESDDEYSRDDTTYRSGGSTYGSKKARHRYGARAVRDVWAGAKARTRTRTARAAGRKVAMHRVHRPHPKPPLEAGSATVTVTVLCPRNLSVAKRADRATYAPGEVITFTVTVSNTGTDAIPLAEITVADPMLPTLSLVGPAPAAVAPGGVLTYTGQLATTVANCGNIVNTVTVTAPGDVNPADNTASVTVAVAGPLCPPTVTVGGTPSAPGPVTPQPVAFAPPPTTLLVDKTAPASARARTRVPYRITVTNTGTAVAIGVVVSDRVPEGMLVVRRPKKALIRDGVVTWRVGDLAPGASATVGLWMRQSANRSAERCNTATVGASNAPVTQDAACTRFIKVAGVRRLPVTG